MNLRHQSIIELRKSSKAGFTIIETMIVLAIAGLILTIVFLAIPALERNSRNNQRKQDVQAILEEVSNYELNHSGDLPAQTDICSFFSGNNNLSYYVSSACNGQTSSSITFTTYSYPEDASYSNGSDSLPPLNGAHDGPNTNINTVELFNYEKCDNSAPGEADGTGAGYNDVVALYAAETQGGVNSFCQNI
jgi:prepilin-type N-terminal cleavage/methylation domain-containing protein